MKLVSKHFLRRTARARAAELNGPGAVDLEPDYVVRKTYARLYRWGVYQV